MLAEFSRRRNERSRARVAFDVLRVPMSAATGTDSVDQFTIQFVNMADTDGTVQMRWEKTIAKVPFTVGR